ncbi:hypothetical protein Tco_0604854 [Tanacetum coccineum]
MPDLPIYGGNKTIVCPKTSSRSSNSSRRALSDLAGLVWEVMMWCNTKARGAYTGSDRDTGMMRLSWVWWEKYLGLGDDQGRARDDVSRYSEKILATSASEHTGVVLEAGIEIPRCHTINTIMHGDCGGVALQTLGL